MKKAASSGSIAFAGAMLLTGPLQAQSGTADTVLGTWQNPSGSVDVQIEMCGRDLCGVVVRASPTAIADARKGGTADLVGTHLLQNFTRVDNTAWSGTAFVPDMNLHVAGHLTLTDATHLNISSCDLGGLVCRSQVWTRIA